MKIILAILLPPLAVLLTGKPIAFVINLLCCLLFWIPGIVHAVWIVTQAETERRHRETLAALRK